MNRAAKIAVSAFALVSAQELLFAQTDAPAERRSADARISAPAAGGAENLSDAEKLIAYLVDKNPFGSDSSSAVGVAGAIAQVAEAPKGLELRSIFCVDDKWFFSLADTLQKTFYTIPLGKRPPDNCPYTVDFFDDESNSVSISNNVGTYTLTLKVQDAPSGKVPALAEKAKAASAAAKKNTQTQQNRPQQMRVYRNNNSAR